MPEVELWLCFAGLAPARITIKTFAAGPKGAYKISAMAREYDKGMEIVLRGKVKRLGACAKAGLPLA